MLKDYVKRLKLEKIMQGSIYALSGGLLAAAIMVMIFQLLGLIEWYFYLISVLGGLVVLFIILSIYYFVNKVSDKEAAKRIDQNFNLREKASTMVEFKGQDSLLINKQREDAEKSIKLKSPKKLILKMTMASLPLPLLGAGAFTTSFFTQDIVNMLKVDEIEDNFDDETDQIIDDIKDYIGKSQASAAFKEKLYQILEELREDLKGDTSIPSRQAKVDAAKEEVDVALDEVNTKEEIGNELLNEESDFTELGTILLEANVEAIEGAFDVVLSKLDKIYTTSGLLDNFEEWIKALEHLLKNVDVPSSDANYSTFSDLLAKFQAIYDNVEEKIAGSSNASASLINKLIRDSQEQAKKAIEEAIEKLKTDISLEKANDQLAEDVKKLMDQLVDPDNVIDSDEGMEGGQGDQDGEEGDAGDKGDQETDTGDGEEGGAEGGEGNGDGNKGEGSGTGSGGQEGEGDGQGQGEGAAGGGGETEYGSNDKVYTGEKGETEYGDVIGDYQNEASDDAKNTGDDDLEGAIGDYFDELYGEGNNNQTNP